MRKQNKNTNSMRRKGQKREVVFDPEARKAYLRGFSERKKQRRAYGLAMQKVKDRKAKIEERAQIKKDELERVEQAENQKNQFLAESVEINQGIREEESDDESQAEHESVAKTPHNDKPKKEEKEKEGSLLERRTYDDKDSKAHWGGRVTVTTSELDMVDFDSDKEDEQKSKAVGRSNDQQQQEAGQVEKFLSQLKGNMPSKKNKDKANSKRKGRNGAAEMKGVGGAGNLKIAQKVLIKAKTKQKGTSGKKKGGKRGR